MQKFKSKSILAPILGTLAFSHLLYSPLSHAQSDAKGNGGRVTVCYGSLDPATQIKPIISAKFVDYDEAKAMSKWTIDLGPDQAGIDDTDTMIKVALDRLRLFDPTRADIIAKRVHEIETTYHPLDIYKEFNTIALIADSTDWIKPVSQNCDQIQAAFSKTNPGVMDYKYVIVTQVLSKLSDRDRAGLFLHEAFRAEEGDHGNPTGNGAKEMVKAISSLEFVNTLTFRQKFETFYNSSVSHYPVLSEVGLIKSVREWNSEDRILSAELTEDTHYDLFTLSQRPEFVFEDSVMIIAGGNQTFAFIKSENKLAPVLASYDTPVIEQSIKEVPYYSMYLITDNEGQVRVAGNYDPRIPLMVKNGSLPPFQLESFSFFPVKPGINRLTLESGNTSLKSLEEKDFELPEHHGILKIHSTYDTVPFLIGLKWDQAKNITAMKVTSPSYYNSCSSISGEIQVTDAKGTVKTVHFIPRKKALFQRCVDFISTQFDFEFDENGNFK